MNRIFFQSFLAGVSMSILAMNIEIDFFEYNFLDTHQSDEYNFDFVWISKVKWVLYLNPKYE